MKRVELRTREGFFVAIVEIPFLVPDVILWGTRVFGLKEVDVYEEAFAVVSLTPFPGLPRG